MTRHFLATLLVGIIFIHPGCGADEGSSPPDSSLECDPREEQLIRGRCCTFQEMETDPDCFPQEISSPEREPDDDNPDQEFDPQECSEALAQLGIEDSGALRACAACMSSAYQSPDDDGVPDLSDPEDLQEFFDRDALKECACGLQCGTLFSDFFRVIEKNCSQTSLFDGPQYNLWRAAGGISDDSCDIVEDWPENDPCAPRRQDRSESETRVCMVHNDPHVIRFGSDAQDQQTCNQTGTFTLLENDFFSVTAEAEPVPFDEAAPWRGASVVTAVTFEYKNSSCSLFEDSQSQTFRAAEMVRSTEVIRDPRLWTTVTLNKQQMRQQPSIGFERLDFLTLNIRTPYHAGGSGVCVDGCAPEDTVDMQDLFGRRRQLLDISEAEDRCMQGGLEGKFQETCVFDSVGTGSETFVESTQASSTSYSQSVTAAEEENKEFAEALDRSSVPGNGGSSSESNAGIAIVSSGLPLGTLVTLMATIVAHI